MNFMIRVLQIGMTDNWGGIESYIMNYYRNIDKTKVQFDFVNIYNNELCFQNEIEQLGGKIYKVSSYYKHPIKYIRELKNIIIDNNYEIIHCNMNSAVFLYPLIAAKIAKAKVIIAHSHNSSSDKGVIKALLHNINKHFIPFFANKFFACSNKAGKWFYSSKILKSNDYYVIKNSINTNIFRFNDNIRKEKRAELKVADNTILIGHVGRFNKQKNHIFLIDVFNEYHRNNKNSKLLLVGIGPLKEKVESKVKELKLIDNVLFLEQRKDVNELMMAMDVFVLPSLYEGLPLVGVEAQAAGLPCIFSDSITDEIKISNNAQFVSLRDNIEKWSNILGKYTFKYNRSKEFKRVKAFGYDIEDSCCFLISLYEKIRGE